MYAVTKYTQVSLTLTTTLTTTRSRSKDVVTCNSSETLCLHLQVVQQSTVSKAKYERTSTYRDRQRTGWEPVLFLSTS
jgi:hypothetical protein